MADTFDLGKELEKSLEDTFLSFRKLSSFVDMIACHFCHSLKDSVIRSTTRSVTSEGTRFVNTEVAFDKVQIDRHSANYTDTQCETIILGLCWREGL